ncbi:SMP-30/gluconolactonase/LRE family protein [Chitinophaga barathri]|uniref:SMP-30/gluconolactonase/LRE family protein n=1 Tax=Chitinophaga barathri TaxID=1647451 RepID=A0A3N4MEP2_9BACT|nr:SMP-30/gluconolactonase/LRE family protein [Chitinophaga barathri]RPD42271.1 SMP-30/gluconolactonase/LRE family protein [Chitinophaga barathri]
MMKTAALLLLTLSVQAQSDSLQSLVADNAQVTLVSKQFSFTEGPARDKKGNIYFTDQPNDKIWIYNTAGKLTEFASKSGRSNGLYVDKKGRIIACADDQNELWAFTPKGKHTVLMSDYQGKKLNGPNDLWIHPNGNIYFTDPYYQRNYWERKKPDIEAMRVYYLAPGKKEPVMVADDIVKPNGIVGSADGKYLFVADIGDNKTYRYEIQADGSLSNRILFTNKGGDGITLDNLGNLYICGNGITVFNPEGKQIAQIPVPEKWTANACFGGKNRDELFITAGVAVYTLKMKVKGIE